MGPSRSCWNGTTSALQQEEITSKGTSFMCILSIKVPIRKMSGNLFNDPRIYIYIYIYIYIGSISRIHSENLRMLHMNQSRELLVNN